jgi:hypothetical protein
MEPVFLKAILTFWIRQSKTKTTKQRIILPELKPYKKNIYETDSRLNITT